MLVENPEPLGQNCADADPAPVCSLSQVPYPNRPKNSRIRWTPLSTTSPDTAYDRRICSAVPNASPGTTTTCASVSTFDATSAADLSPPLPMTALALGYT